MLFCRFLNSHMGVREDGGVVFSTIAPQQKGPGFESNLVEFVCSSCICEGCIRILWLPPVVQRHV